MTLCFVCVFDFIHLYSVFFVVDVGVDIFKERKHTQCMKLNALMVFSGQIDNFS